MTKECESLASSATSLYYLEFLGGLYVLFQSLFGVILLDKLKNHKMISITRASCQISLLALMIIYIVRIILYMNVHSALVVVNPKHKDPKGFGAFLAEYVNDVMGSYILTCFWLVVYIIFYISNFYMIYLMKRLSDFIRTKEDEEKV